MKTITRVAFAAFLVTPACAKDYEGRVAKSPEPVSAASPADVPVPKRSAPATSAQQGVGASGVRGGEGAIQPETGEQVPTDATGSPQEPSQQYEEPQVEVTVPQEGDIVVGNEAPGVEHANRADLAIEADVRRAIVERDDVSPTAKDVRISSQNGHVVLEGAVESKDERALIDALTRSTSGVRSVDDRLTVVAH